MLAIDLHSHSQYSDGLLGPEELVARAALNGAKALALTGHDMVRGTGEAKQACRRAGIHLVIISISPDKNRAKEASLIRRDALQ